MKTVNKTNKISALLSKSVIVILTVILASCTGWDEYKEYTKDGEIVYPGKVQALEINSGHYRVQVVGALGPDNRVTEVRIFWNDYKDSLVVAVDDQIMASGFDEFISVEEGLQTYTLHTYDEFGNISLPTQEIGISFGDRYQEQVKNKVVSSIFTSDTSTFIVWRPIDTSTGAQYVSVDYEVDDVAMNAQFPVTQDTTELAGLIVSDSIYYHTVYIPRDNCIDLFYSDTTKYDVVR
jgi:hypothetical protein